MAGVEHAWVPHFRRQRRADRGLTHESLPVALEAHAHDDLAATPRVVGPTQQVLGVVGDVEPGGVRHAGQADGRRDAALDGCDRKGARRTLARASVYVPQRAGDARDVAAERGLASR